MKYETYKYLYPPRAERKENAAVLQVWCNGEYIAQPKYNGDCCVVAIHGDELIIRNRHNDPKDHVDKSIDLKGLRSLSEGWIVLAGEMLDKAKKDEHGQILKGFVVWDVLVYNSVYLFGWTVMERVNLLETLLPGSRMKVMVDGSFKEYEHLLFTNIDGVYRAPSYLSFFPQLYEKIIKTDLYEGLVVKKMTAKLELGFQAKNNSRWQVKFRKPNKNYNF